ncbi:hypothetical protein SOVF_111210 [Spinacia oleracea]|nr:hypothetical protein SOVF_111210 [Spinacia oleracea]
MTTLMKKEAKFEWNDQCEEAFQALKTRLTTAPVLTLPDESGTYDVYSDASKNGLGCVLMQNGKDQNLIHFSFPPFWPFSSQSLTVFFSLLSKTFHSSNFINRGRRAAAPPLYSPSPSSSFILNESARPPLLLSISII